MAYERPSHRGNFWRFATNTMKMVTLLVAPICAGYFQALLASLGGVMKDSVSARTSGSVAASSGAAGGFLLCLMSAGLFAISITSSKFVYQYDVGPLFFSATRALMCVVLCAAYIAVKGGVWFMPLPSRRYILPMSAALLMVSFGYPTAMKFIPAGLATLLFYLWPMLVLVFSSINARRLPGFRQIGIFLAAFFGLGLVLGASLGDLSWQGIAAALVAALGAGLYFIIIPLVTKHADSMTINVNLNLWVGVVLAVAAFAEGDVHMPNAIGGWYFLGGAGLAYGMAMVLVIQAVQRAGPVTSSVLFNTEPLIVTVLAAVFLAEILEPLQYTGIMIVVAAVMYASTRMARP